MKALVSGNKPLDNFWTIIKITFQGFDNFIAYSNLTMTHTVKPQETLYAISRKYNVSVDQIKQLNGLISNDISIGQVLYITFDDAPVYPNANPVTPNYSDNVYPNTPPSYPSTPTYPSTPSYNTPSGNYNNNNNNAAVGIEAFQVRKENKGSYNSIVISYPSDYGTDSTNPMRDNYPSPNLVNPRGVSYFGKSTFDSQRAQFEDLCPRPFYADILHFIGKNEGSFDAVNSYDKAIFSFGFIQFTGAVASGSMLTRVLQRFKNNNQSAFYQSFGQFGLDISTYGTPLFTVNTGYGQKQGDEAYREVANNLQLTGVFIASGFEREMIRAQIQIAQEEYMNKALADSTSVAVLGQGVSLNRVLYSEGGIALRVDLCVNRGLSGSLAVLQKAIAQVAAESGIYSVASLGSIDERRVVETVANNDIEQWKKDRTRKLLSSNFSFDKYSV
jgi:peptidoglycan endopeptidase LytF